MKLWTNLFNTYRCLSLVNNFLHCHTEESSLRADIKSSQHCQMYYSFPTERKKQSIRINILLGKLCSETMKWNRCRRQVFVHTQRNGHSNSIFFFADRGGKKARKSRQQQKRAKIELFNTQHLVSVPEESPAKVLQINIRPKEEGGWTSSFCYIKSAGFHPPQRAVSKEMSSAPLNAKNTRDPSFKPRNSVVQPPFLNGVNLKSSSCDINLIKLKKRAI